MHLRALIIFFGFCLFAFNTGNAFYSSNPCTGLSFDAEWIYFRPSVDCSTVMAAFTAPGISTTQELPVNPRYHSGWRVGTSYLFAGNKDSISLRYTQLKTTDTRDFAAAFFIAGGFTGGPGFANDRLNFSAYITEGLYRHTFCCDCRASFDVLAGIQYAWIGAKEKVLVSSDPEGLTLLALVNQHSRFWGIGPELGLNLKCYLACGFSLVCDGTVAVLASRNHVHLETNSAIALFNLLSTPSWKVTLSWDLRGGLRFEKRVCCINFYAEGGYETITYSQGMKRALFDSTFLSFVDASMHGPYVSLGIIF